jgi:hypothetical protein
MEDIQQYKHLFLDDDYICINPNINLDIIHDTNMDIKLNGNLLSLNPSITWDIVTRYPEIEWNYHTLSSNPMNFI